MRLSRQIWTVIGLVCVGSGFVGTVVPGWPTTVFMILALYCFKRGNEKFEQWLLNHPVFGPTLRDWERYKGIRKKHKVIAITMMWVFIGLSLVVLYMKQKPVVMAIVAATGVIGTWYIMSRPTVPETVPGEDQIKVSGEDQAFLG